MTKWEVHLLNEKLVPQGKRCCTLCQQIFPLSSFAKNNYRCKRCTRAIVKESYYKRKQRKIEEHYQNTDQE